VVESLVIDTQLIQLDTSLKISASLTMKTIATDKKTNEKRVLTAVLQKRGLG
jgi:hypothetical protein